MIRDPLLNDVQAQAPQAICELRPTNGAATIIMNRSAPPLDNPDLPQVMALTLDRKAFVDTLTGWQGKIGAAMMPPPEGVWGMPADMLRTLPGYDPDVHKSRGEARKLMGLSSIWQAGTDHGPARAAALRRSVD